MSKKERERMPAFVFDRVFKLPPGMAARQIVINGNLRSGVARSQRMCILMPREDRERLELFNQACVGSASVDDLESELEAFTGDNPYFCDCREHSGSGCAGDQPSRLPVGLRNCRL